MHRVQDDGDDGYGRSKVPRDACVWLSKGGLTAGRQQVDINDAMTARMGRITAIPHGNLTFDVRSFVLPTSSAPLLRISVSPPWPPLNRQRPYTREETICKVRESHWQW